MPISSHLKIIFSSLILLTLFSIPACQEEPGASEPIYTTQQGIIKDIAGDAVVNAVVEALNVSKIVIDADTTDENGGFKLLKIPNDFKSVLIRIVHPDFQPFEQNLQQLDQNKVGNDINIILNYNDTCCNRVEFEVTNKNNDESLSDVEIKLSRRDQVIRKSKTNDNGSLIYNNICNGEYWVRLYKQGFKVIEEDFQVSGCDTVRLSFEMESLYNESDSCCNGVVYLTIKDSQGNPVQGAYTKIWKKNTDQKRELTTGSDGRVIFRELCPGEYGAYFTKDGYKAQDFSFEMGCNDTLEFNKTIQANERDSCCNGVVYLTIKDSENRAVQGVYVKLWKGSTKIKEFTTGEDGRVIIRELCQGNYGISFSKDGYKGQEFNFELGCNDTLEFNKTILANERDSCCNGRIKIYAKDKNTGEYLQYGTVKLIKDNQIIGAKSLTNGWAVFEELCEGRYTVKIISETHKAIEFVVELGCNENKEIVKEMESNQQQDSCCNGVVYFIVKNRENNPIQGVTVKLWQGSTLLKGLSTGEDGRVIFKNLCIGNYQISFFKDGYQGQEFNFELGCNDTLEFNKTMYLSERDSCCNGKIIIYLKDKETGNLTSYATVKLWKGSQAIASKTPSNGKVVFEGLCEGNYGVDIISDKYQSIEFGIELGCNEAKEITKYLELRSTTDTCETARLKLKIVNGEEQAIQGATIKIEYSWGGSKETTTNSEGWGVFEGLIAPMTYTVTVSKDGYTTKTFTIRFNECNTIMETVKLLRE